MLKRASACGSVGLEILQVAAAEGVCFRLAYSERQSRVCQDPDIKQMNELAAPQRLLGSGYTLVPLVFLLRKL